MGRQESVLHFLKEVMFICIAFLAVFGFLHQKVIYFVYGYELSADNCKYNMLKDKKDAVLYEVSQKTAITKVNGWRAENEFDVAWNNDVSVLRAPSENRDIERNSFAEVLGEFMLRGSRLPNAFAQER